MCKLLVILFIPRLYAQFIDITITHTDQEGRLLEIIDKVNFRLIINK